MDVKVGAMHIEVPAESWTHRELQAARVMPITGHLLCAQASPGSKCVAECLKMLTQEIPPIPVESHRTEFNKFPL